MGRGDLSSRLRQSKELSKQTDMNQVLESPVNEGEVVGGALSAVPSQAKSESEEIIMEERNYNLIDLLESLPAVATAGSWWKDFQGFGG